jgi:hypothetical protein
MRLSLLAPFLICLVLPAAAEGPDELVKLLKPVAADANVHVLCRKKQECGLMNSAGELILEQTYRRLVVSPLTPGVPRQVIAEPVGGKTGIFDLTGKWLLQPSSDYEELSFLHNDRIAVKRDRKWGYADGRGNMVIPPQFESAGDFLAPAAVVRGRENLGLIDRHGTPLTPHKYIKIGDFVDGVAEFMDADVSAGLIDLKGREIVTGFVVTGPLSEGLALAFKSNTEKGYIDRNGKWVIKTKFGVRGDFSEGLAIVDAKGKRGYLARNGKLAIPFKYDSAKAFSSGVAAVAQKRKWGVIDLKGRFLVKPELDYIDSFVNDIARANRGGNLDEYGLSEGAEGLWGVIDKSGKWIIEPQYETLEITGDLIKAWNGGYQYFTVEGRPIQMN